MNEHPSPEFEKEIRETLGASGADPAFVHNLRVTLLERSKMKKQTRSFYRLAWGLAAAVLLIGLLVASPRAVEALKQLLGYVPGLGYMEQGNSLRILTAPVTLEKDGLKLTVTKGATDSKRTILLAHLEGNPPDQENEPNCITPSHLVLPDGTLLKEMGHEGGTTPSGSYYERYEFEAMPTGQLEATLEIPCVRSDPDFTDFALPLNFEVADEGQVMPLIELPTASSEDAPASSAGSTLEGFSIVLGDETPLPDGYVLSGSYEWTDPRFEAFSVHVRAVEILDANGQAVIFEPVDPGSFMDPAVKKLPFAYQITGKDHAYPLTLTVNSIAADLPSPSGSTFQFDAGTDPQVGQVWDVDIDVPVDEHIIHVQTIKLTAGAAPTQLGFTFSMTSDPSVLGARVDDIDPAITGNGAGSGGGGGGGRAANNVFECSWAFEGYSPSGLKTFVVSNITILLNETSQATWQPSGQ